MRHITVLIVAAAATTAGAQSPIPIRTIGPILATSTENVGQAVTVRATSDGHVIVGAGARQKVYAFDSTLKTFTIVVDSGAGTGQIGIRTTGVIPYLADSTLLPDFSANALLVLDATGKQIRSMAPPRAQDLMFLGIPAAFGRPGFDQKGRLIYRTQAPPNVRPTPTPSGDQKVEMIPVNPDSAPIVRGDFDTRRIDTVAWLKTPVQGRMAMDIKQNPAGGPPSLTMRMQINPSRCRTSGRGATGRSPSCARTTITSTGSIPMEAGVRRRRCQSSGGATPTTSGGSGSIPCGRSPTNRSIANCRRLAPVGCRSKWTWALFRTASFRRSGRDSAGNRARRPGRSSLDSADDVDERAERPHLRRCQSERRGDRASAATEGSRAGRVWPAQYRVFDEGRRRCNVSRAGDAHRAAKELNLTPRLCPTVDVSAL